MKIEHVAGIGLASGRTAQEQRELPIGGRLLAEVIIDAERVTVLLVHEILGHGAAAIGRHVLQRSGHRSGGVDHDRVVHGAALGETLHNTGHGRGLLADRDVDADHIAALLVDDRIDRDSRLAGTAVADDQLALASSDRDHAVDSLDARLQRLLHRLAIGDTGSIGLHRAKLVGLQRALAVEGVTERVHHPADELLANGNLQHGAGALDRVALAQVIVLAEDNGSDTGLFEVESNPG